MPNSPQSSISQVTCCGVPVLAVSSVALDVEDVTGPLIVPPSGGVLFSSSDPQPTSDRAATVVKIVVASRFISAQASLKRVRVYREPWLRVGEPHRCCDSRVTSNVLVVGP